MSTPRKIGGYADKQELNRALRANKAARRLIGRILEERPGQTRLALMLAEISQQLSIELESLVEMERIRRDVGEEKSESQGGGSPALAG